MLPSKKLSALVLLLSGLLTIRVTPGLAGPGDAVVQMTAAQFGVPEAKSLEVPGDLAKVASRTGAFEYSFPIVVPPGRAGMQPELALHYSSQNPLYGGFAAGWSLSLPEIKIDPTIRTRLGRRQPKSQVWVSGLAGGHELVPVDEAGETPRDGEYGSYRAHYDDSFARYEHQPSGVWIARTTDGKKYTFGEAENILRETDQSPIDIDKLIGRRPLTSSEDAFGNRIDYYYLARVGTAVESLILTRIEYTKNPALSVNGLDHHAEIRFDYFSPVRCTATAQPVGAALDHHFQFKWVSGDRAIARISTWVESSGSFQEARAVEFSYQNDCSPFAGGVRFLRSITERAPAVAGAPGGDWVSLPPVTFEYGPSAVTYDQRKTWSVTSGVEVDHRGSLEWGKRESAGRNHQRHTVQSKLIDLDGDGILDRIQADFAVGQSAPGGPAFYWEPGVRTAEGAAISFEHPQSQIVALPSLSSVGTTPANADKEHFSLAGQVSYGQIYSPTGNAACEPQHMGNLLTYRFMDVDGDGRADLVTGLSYDPFYYDPALDADWAGVLSQPPGPFDPPPQNGGAFFAPWHDVGRWAIECLDGQSCAFDESAIPALQALVQNKELWSGSWGQSVTCADSPNDSSCVAALQIGEPQPGTCDAPNTGCCSSSGDALEDCCQDWATEAYHQNDCSLIPPECPGAVDGCLVSPSCGGTCPGDSDGIGDDDDGWHDGGDLGAGGEPGHGGGNCNDCGCDYGTGMPECPKPVCRREGSQRKHLERDHRNILLWYRNRGPENGFFALSSPAVMRSPIPLDPDVAGEGLGLTLGDMSRGSSIVGKSYGFFDIDGDGLLDAVKPTGESVWQVYRGTGTGAFVGDPSYGGPYLWPVPEPYAGITGELEGAATSRSEDNVSSLGGRVVRRSFSTGQLADVNGDGLVDLLAYDWRHGQHTKVYLNNGAGFLGAGQRPNLADEIIAPSYLNATEVELASQTASVWDSQVSAGEGKSLIRLVDWDQDGRSDLFVQHDFEPAVQVGLSNTIQEPRAAFDRVMASPALYTNPGMAPFREDRAFAGARFLAQTNRFDSVSWETNADFVDVDGDGLPEALRHRSGRQWDMLSMDLRQGVPRLLKSVDNGRGLTTRVTYKSSADPSSRTESHSERGMPQSVWVVDTVTTTDAATNLYASGQGVATLEQTVRYGAPVWNQEKRPDGRGRYGFRGFEEIETSAPHAPGDTDYAVTVERYGFEVDWSGRLVESVQYANAAKSLVASVARSDYAERALFGGASKSFVLVGTQSWNCAGADGNFSTYEDCVTEAPSQTEQLLYRAVPSNTEDGAAGDAMWLLRDRYQANSLEDVAEGDRHREHSYALYFDASRYQIQKTRERDEEWRAGAWNAYKARSFHPSTDGRRIEKISELVEDKIETALETVYEHDADTGQVLSVQKPQQVADGTSKSEVVYDRWKIFAERTVNELGHTTTLETDLGTGAQTRASGPNVVTCPDQSTGPASTQTVVDGFARPISIREWGCASGSYEATELKTLSYESYSVIEPSRVVERTRIEYGGSQWTEVEHFYDGHGRTVRTRTFLGDGGVANHYFHYGKLGKLSHYDVPNPSASSDSARSHYSYAYDNLGRLIGMRVADAASGVAPAPGTADWSTSVGLDVRYGFADGLATETRSEVVQDGGPRASTTTYRDRFGELLRVDEATDTGVATTHYGYDGGGNLQSIEDPDGVQTFMEHDWMGRRLSIRRGDRAWLYEYDRNGNVILETVPYPAGSNLDDYTVSMVYDDLDRVTSVSAIGTRPRDLEGGQITQFGEGAVYTHYDSAKNGIGQVASITSNSFITAYAYDWAGRVAEERRDFNLEEEIAAGIHGGRVQSFRYDALGQVKETWYGDAQDLSERTQVTFETDGAGLADRLLLHSKGGATVEVANLGRNAAQVVTTRESGCVVRRWHYDALGRVIQTAVEGGCGAPVELLKEAMTYYDSSEVASQRVERSGLPTRTFGYDYDRRHQLVAAWDDVSDSTRHYDALFSFGDGGRVESAYVGEASAAAQLVARDVRYVYGDGKAADEHAPVALLDVGSGNPVARYVYDRAGNVTTREESSKGTWSFAYDSFDQQREVVSENGARELYYYSDAGTRTLAVRLGAGGAVERVRFWLGGAEVWFDGSMQVQKELAHLGIAGLSVARVERDNSDVPLEYSFHNGLGHFMGSVTPEGELRSAFVYGPFGELLDELDPSADHLRQFGGKEADEVSRLSYYGYRYYDPLSLSWTQADPLYLIAPDLAYDQPRRMGLYQFVLGNPVRYVDPDGRRPDMGPMNFEMALDQAQYEVSMECGTPCAVVGGLAAVAVVAPFALMAGGVGIADIAAAALVAETAVDLANVAAAAHDAAANPGAQSNLGVGLAVGDLLSGPNPAGDVNSARVLSASKAPRLHAGKQGKHVPGHNNFQKGKSELTHRNPQELLDKGAGTGTRHGNKEVVDFGQEIGVQVGQDGTRTTTSRGTIHYDKDGNAHIVPAKPKAEAR